MRILVVGTPRSDVRHQEPPGLVRRRRYSIAAVTITLALSLCGIASAQTAQPVPERVTDQAGEQSAPASERSYSEAPAAAEPAGAEPLAAPAAAVAPTVSADDGL